jgi:hypothetical protein
VEVSCEHGDEPSGSLRLLRIFWMAAQLAASQEGLSSVSKLCSDGQLKEYLSKHNRMHSLKNYYIYWNLHIFLVRHWVYPMVITQNTFVTENV